MEKDIQKQLIELGFCLDSNIKNVEKGGSSRSFFKFNDKNFGNCIICNYSDEKEENFLYADIASFLKKNDFPTPNVFLHDSQKRVIVMENVGDCDVLDFIKNAKSEEEIVFIYKKILFHVALLHSKISAKFFEKPINLMPKFDEPLYSWEQNYFFENLIKNRLKLDELRPNNEWENLTKDLLKQSECLIHRDLQSQNVIKRNSQKDVAFIDFQGMRLGLHWYDLGSLLFDPYADISQKVRNVLFNYYCMLRGLEPDLCSEIFCKATTQRLMQALGAYAFLADKKGKSEYLNYIPKALENLIFCSKIAKLEKTYQLAQKAKDVLG